MCPKSHKSSYTIPCASSFRDAISALAVSLRGNVADVARSILLTVPEEVIRSIPDPGGPPPGDREQTLIKSGPSAGKLWQRKPRIQVRLRSGYDVSTVRRALNIALRINNGSLELKLANPNALSPETEPDQKLSGEVERLKKIISVLAFDPLQEGVSTSEEALHVLGFAPRENPDKATVRARFRTLATIHHPDSHDGSHHRMSQLNTAMQLLCK
ncbi:J domain-containing protein [Rhodospirillales bacterium]|nr:J domain-containing protein [Rhodospirillales bacterium]